MSEPSECRSMAVNSKTDARGRQVAGQCHEGREVIVKQEKMPSTFADHLEERQMIGVIAARAAQDATWVCYIHVKAANPMWRSTSHTGLHISGPS